KAVLEVGAAMARWILGKCADVSRLPGAIIETRNVSAVFSGINDVRIVRLRDDPSGFAAANAVPITVANACRSQCAARPLCCPDILHGTGNRERHAAVRGYVIELRDGKRGS